MRIFVAEGYIQALLFALYPDGRVLALDGGCHCDVPAMESMLEKELGRQWTDVKLQLVSHIHPDHAGAAPVLKRKYGLLMAAPEGINRWYAGAGGFLQHKIDISLGYFVVYAMKKRWKNIYYRRKVCMDHVLKDGDLLPGFPDWQALSAPGHTNHDMVFYHAQSKTLYAADVILYVNRRFQLPFPVSIPHEMEESLLRIRNLDVERLILAHGGVLQVEGMAEIVDGLLALLARTRLSPLLRRIRPLTRFSPALKDYPV
ncbi:glyoxylase-like metal-dependent hydrolase (beta-lactamase superfamily II) [Desulfobotulus alkaliphilus]|uniref:Glyoxylase-like metal-dependent hydrolase (Beta-lactamase superfamily II) n=1 Tax=Desulfobotulus alkaliphilus TaxID=622671 RepID=A0A562RZ33_9BACT|nr:MBL fold metallo-hydrolase [Desulfobotulus alkaliphilus]TWI74401.1 glyoxylase-like metal-dependent hydrolase (beta-lactamase superfamily II) [Desulfobotulus alkaliphilus]